MNSEQLLEAIGHIDDACLEEAERPKAKKTFFSLGRQRWLRPVAAAACVLLVGAVAVRTVSGARGGKYDYSSASSSAAVAAGETVGGAYYDGGTYESTTDSAADWDDYEYDVDMAEAPAEPMPAPEEASAGTSAVNDAKGVDPARQTSRKIIYTAELNMESTDYDDGLTRLLALLESRGGYMEACSEGGTRENGNRWYNATLRIPSSAYSGFLSAAGDCGNVTWLSQSSRDVTLDYVDLEARISSLKTQRDRLDELAARAETVEDLIAIQQQLSEVEYRLESYASQLRVMENQVSMSTVYLDYREVSITTPTTRTFTQRLGYALANGWENFVHDVQDLILSIGYSLPVLVLLAAAVIAGIVVWKKRSRKNK